MRNQLPRAITTHALPRANHREVAAEARMLPNQWILVRHYDKPDTAYGARSLINRGGLKPYQPAGDFEARIHGEIGLLAVYVRYRPEET